MKEDPLHRKIQSIYKEFVPLLKQTIDDTSRYLGKQNRIAEYGLCDIQFNLYHSTRILTGQEYIELLNTYSDHRALDQIIRIPFFNAIKAAIIEFGNELIINDIVDLYLARKK